MPMPPLESETLRSGAQPDDFRAREFQELRATIRERGHVRVIVTVLTFVSWAALAAALPEPFPPFALVPLLVLAAGFEVGYAIHVSVERIGRYLFVFYEGAAEMPKWETAIAAFGQSAAARSTGGSALFLPAFLLAAALNLLLAWAVPGRAPDASGVVSVAALAAAHALFVVRLFIARAKARRQRELDTAEFRAIAAGLGGHWSPKSN